MTGVTNLDAQSLSIVIGAFFAGIGGLVTIVFAGLISLRQLPAQRAATERVGRQVAAVQDTANGTLTAALATADALRKANDELTRELHALTVAPRDPAPPA